MNAALYLSFAWIVSGLAAAWERLRLRAAAESAAEGVAQPKRRPGLYDVAALYGGGSRVVDAAAAGLVDRDALAVEARGLLVPGGKRDQAIVAVGVETAVRDAVTGTTGLALADVRRHLAKDRVVAAVIARTEELGLVVDPGPARRVWRKGFVLTSATAVAAWIAWAEQGAGVVAFLALAAGSIWILCGILPSPGMPSRRGLALKHEISAGTAAEAVVDDPTLVTGAGWLTTVYGIEKARKLSCGVATLKLPGDPSKSSADHDWGFLSWLFDGGDGDGCGGCSCG